jgi:hypothetical protein
MFGANGEGALPMLSRRGAWGWLRATLDPTPAPMRGPLCRRGARVEIGRPLHRELRRIATLAWPVRRTSLAQLAELLDWTRERGSTDSHLRVARGG